MFSLTGFCKGCGERRAINWDMRCAECWEQWRRLGRYLSAEQFARDRAAARERGRLRREFRAVVAEMRGDEVRVARRR